MIDAVFGIKVRMLGLCINRYRPADNRPLPYRCISTTKRYPSHYFKWVTLGALVGDMPSIKGFLV